ncbi:MAG: hypothetical protein SFV81_15495 [Pirellulaceae bacterium]|nr:hypothetical protein [Pirellulaceae bacterium]
MTADESKSLADRAKALFEGEIREKLEVEHHGKYVAIEPDSHDYFVAATFSEAVRASRNVHPEKLAFVMRVGHLAAIHLGAVSS